MPNRVPLDNVEHGSLRVASRGSVELDNVNQALVVPGEFEEVQREYPIFIRRNQEGQFVAVALLGFEKGENLFLEEGQWSARYIPAAHRRGPFFLGFRDAEQGTSELAVHVDLDDPRVGTEEGDPLFKEHGGNSAYLNHVTDALHVVHEGLASTPPLFAALDALGLVQPIEIEVELGDGASCRLPSMLTIGMDRFLALTGAELEPLHRSGFLAPAIFIRSSLPNLNRLIELKRRKLAGTDG